MRALCCLIAALTLSGWAHAWVETSIRSHVVTLDVEPSGAATVSHELILRVRGGPLPGIEIEGVDADALPQPNATVSEVDGDGSSKPPTPLLLERREDGTLRIDVDAKKGLRRGTYLFRFAYRTNLADRDLIHRNGAYVDVRWVGPRLEDGVDSARVIFRLPPAEIAPRLPPVDPDQAALGVTDDGAGTFLANLRRAGDKDELEVVRPHVAKGEPVVWRVQASARAFPAFAPTDAPAQSSSAQPPPPRVKTRLVAVAVLVGVALFYALLVFLKWRSLRQAAELRQAEPRALIPLPGGLRAALSGVLLSAAVGVGARTNLPTLAGVLLVLAMAAATQLGPRLKPEPRSPGRWLPLTEEDAFEPSAGSLPGRLLDAGSLLGFVLFVLLLGGFVAGAVVLFPRSPYHALMLALASAALLPIFCTGRAAELPPDPAQGPVKLLSWLDRRLAGVESLKVVPWARIPEKSSDPDELRLLVMPRRALAGLSAIEVGLEYRSGGGGTLALPWVMVRAQEGSPAYHALPRGVVWTRGRKPEERVAVIRPALPTKRDCLALVRSLAETLTDSEPMRPRTRQPGIKMPMSAGRRASASKPTTVASPAQAM
ncbi:MAG: hypothetical protein KC776_09095 [Myxococcales bacterium]|nr:hypothetical protein [Myxococcales bacterium]MCB9578836.1 hypothetical protein [Polyangiaceae bacterium]